MNSSYSIFSYASKLIWSLIAIILIPSLYVILLSKTIIIDWTLISIINTPIVITIIIDPIGILFSIIVLFISANVLRFSTIYMSHDNFPNRFTILVLIFILSINLLIFIPNFIILLLGWDGLGIVSFILVIYYQNPKSLSAGIITALTNRIGDVILLLAIAWSVNQGHWLITNIWESKFLIIQSLAIILAAMTKSAQIPFSRWLPAAIAAPTPVSALVHSSTLVTAGVFLILRFYPFLHSTKFFNSCILFIAVSTIFIAGIRATTECDIKKIIALSTLSQLGIIITRIGLNMPILAYFHILTHALFKALLFICAGSFINEHIHTQDLRWMGNLTYQMPTASSCISLANLALCGFPFMAGFYSKDLIMESAINISNNLIIVYISIISLGFTSFYSIRFRVAVLWSPNLCNRFMRTKEHLPIIKPMLFLSLVSISAGSIISWILPIPYSFILPTYLKIIPLIIVTIGLVIALTINIKLKLSISSLINLSVWHFASSIIWYLVPLSSQFIISKPLNFAHNYMKLIDQGWIEILSSQGFHLSIINSSNKVLLHTPKSPTSYLIASGTIFFLLIISSVIYNY